MTKVWSVDVEIAGTAYVKADTAVDAFTKLANWIREEGWIEVRGMGVSSAMLDSPGLPEISLSPMMTVKGPFRGRQMELCFDPEEEME